MLIVLEGNDSCGKGTQVKIIKDYYESLGKTIKHIHFPMYGHNQFSDMIARFLKGEFGSNDEVDPLFVANIYAMDRYCYKDQLIKDLEENDIVLLDRYVLSNLAYQCSKVKSDAERDKLFNVIEGTDNGTLKDYKPLVYFDSGYQTDNQGMIIFNDTLAKQSGLTHQSLYFPTALTDSECIALTTL